MRSRFLRSAMAAWLVMLLGILNTGLPSHSHAVERPDATPDHKVISADHHSHGMILVEQIERVQSTGVQLPVTPESRAVATFTAPVHPVAPQHPTLLRPSGRAPPPEAPRAPPQYL